MIFNRSQLQAYNYTEIGYTVTVNCYQNSSSECYLTAYSNLLSVALWFIGGYLPNSVPNNLEYYLLLAWSIGSDNIHSLTWSAVVNDNRNMIAITAAESYAPLNQTHCSVTFALLDFTVTVHATTHSILVHPQPPASHALIDIESTGCLTANAMYSMNLLSRMSTSL